MARKRSKQFFCVKVNAGHDPNGNPKRGWLVYNNNGYFIGFADEGYSGTEAVWDLVDRGVDEVVWLDTIPTTKTFYNQQKKRRSSRY